MALAIMLLVMMMLIFPFMKHPLSMGLILMLQTIITALISGMMNNNSFMLSYIIMITMLSGALVLFIYMASIASNEKFKTSSYMLMFIVMWMMMSTYIMMFTDETLLNSSNLMNYSYTIVYDQAMTMSNLFNKQSMMLTMMLVLYLLYTMVSVTYIVNVYEGPMRKKS